MEYVQEKCVEARAAPRMPLPTPEGGGRGLGERPAWMGGTFDGYRFSTRDYPSGQRFESWAEHNRLRELTMCDESDDGFAFDQADVPFGQMLLGFRRFASSAAAAPSSYRFVRTTTLIRQDGFDFFYLLLNCNDTVRYEIDGQGREQPHSCLALLDMSKPFSATVPEGESLILTVPRSMIPVSASVLHGRILNCHASLLLMSQLQLAARYLPVLRAEQIAHIAQGVLNLLHAVFTPGADVAEQSPYGAEHLQHERAKQYIEANLDSPDLKVEQICREVGLSRSALYRLFAPMDGVATYIRRRRLIKIRGHLLAHQASHRTISELAYRYGFNSPTQFCRAYKQYFGYTPRESRSLGLGGRWTGLVDPSRDYGAWLRASGV
ncbi:AraC family transcriptional regulator [Burkholderia sp. FERM BP-3421]|jgi:AraC-like DNA-binding protein|uniref:AraC family transcriptional regulator n=1 Tax=Burkholderia sp. FERM BP-3421 TaxID=1494466 RepID=UPI002362F1C4|nr:AraC family transcriptional regulator [Burkholderia sp. FERM BP-3421]WDD93619.1 AraC family transcriptional regulator [Burkholderia sp. FERM BP-3421]